MWGSSGWIVTVRIRANGSTQYESTFRSAECIHRLANFPTPICPPASARLTIPFDVPVGGQTEVFLRGSVQAGGLVVLDTGGSASAGGAADLGNTIGWGGVVSLATQAEAPVTDFSMVSADTGIDYRFAQASVVPEPDGAALGAVALATLVACRARRRRTGGGCAPRARLR